MNYYNDVTAHLYQCGKEVDDAVRLGADRIKFESLEDEFYGGSIPCHLIHGFKRTEPYSCSYHQGMGELLKKIIKQHSH